MLFHLSYTIFLILICNFPTHYNRYNFLFFVLFLLLVVHYAWEVQYTKSPLVQYTTNEIHEVQYTKQLLVEPIATKVDVGT